MLQRAGRRLTPPTADSLDTVTDPTPDGISTVAGAVQAEIDKIKGSRFICDLAPTSDERAALEFVDSVRAA